jgi:hypothetical protein
MKPLRRTALSHLRSFVIPHFMTRDTLGMIAAEAKVEDVRLASSVDHDCGS